MARDLTSSSALARTRAVWARADDPRQLRLDVIDVLRSCVGFDAYAWLLTDPVTEVGSSPLADVPWLHELPRAIGLRYREPVNRWTSLVGPVGRLRVATGDDPGRSAMWRELLAGYGVFDLATVVFRDRYGCWGYLDLWREAPRGAFTDADAELLASVADDITTAIRRCQALTFDHSPAPATPRGPAVLVLAPDLTLRAHTEDTAGILARLVPRDDADPPVPAGAYNVAAQLLACEQAVDLHAPWARVHLGDGSWLTLRAARMGPADPNAAHDSGARDPGAPHPEARDIAVTIEAASPAERLDLFTRAHGLSPRESELVGLVVTGADTRAIAQTMFVSEHTVQDHLKSVFAKTGAGNRRRLVARVQG